MSSRLERLLHFVTSHSARDVPKVGIGSGQVSSLFKSNAGKQSLKFRFPDAAIRHLVLATLCGPSPLGRHNGSLPSAVAVQRCG